MYMKKSYLIALTSLFLSVAFTKTSVAQSDYQTAIGLGIDFGDGSTLVGPSVKHFFTENNVGAAELLFGDNIVALQAFYQYHKEFDGAEGLRWFAGIGPGFIFGNNNTLFRITPMGGIDYKIDGAPISLSFDWRPSIFIGDGGSDVEGARFGLGFRYAF